MKFASYQLTPLSVAQHATGLAITSQRHSKHNCSYFGNDGSKAVSGFPPKPRTRNRPCTSISHKPAGGAGAVPSFRARRSEGRGTASSIRAGDEAEEAHWLQSKLRGDPRIMTTHNLMQSGPRLAPELPWLDQNRSALGSQIRQHQRRRFSSSGQWRRASSRCLAGDLA